MRGERISTEDMRARARKIREEIRRETEGG